MTMRYQNCRGARGRLLHFGIWILKKQQNGLAKPGYSAVRACIEHKPLKICDQCRLKTQLSHPTRRPLSYGPLLPASFNAGSGRPVIEPSDSMLADTS